MKKLPLERPEHLRIEEAFRGWLEAVGYSASTAEGAPTAARELMHWLEQKNLSLTEATESDVEAYLKALANRPNERTGEPLSESYLKKHAQAIRLLATYLRRSGRRAEAKGLVVPDGWPASAVASSDASAPASEETPRVLTREEVRQLRAGCRAGALGLRDRAMLSIYYGCGLRRSEGVALNIGDVLFSEGLLHVRQGKGRKERYVPLSEGVERDLLAYLRHGRPQLLNTDGANPTEKALLVSRRGSRITGQSLLLRVKRLAERAGLDPEEIRLHTLRHAIATHLLQGDLREGGSHTDEPDTKGMPIEEIRRFLGHESLESTQIYTHLADEL